MGRYRMISGWGLMKLLLDSHTFIRWDNDLGRLSPRALALCQRPGNTLLLSVASVWAMQIKVQLGKLKLPSPLGQMVQNQQNINHVEVLPISVEHVLALDSLPLHYRDPFDRMIVAQANVEGAVLLSQDAVFSLYPVDVQ